MDGPKTAQPQHLGMVLKDFCRVVTTDPQELRPKPCGFPWELVIYLAIIGLLSFLLLLWRSFQSIQSRLYARREKKLAVELLGLIEEKCKLLEILNHLQKKHDGLLSSLKDASSTETHTFQAAYEKVEISKSKLEEVLLLENELIEEKLKHCKQVELNLEMSKMIQCLEDESKHIKSNVAKAKTTLQLLQTNEAHLKDSTTEALKENSQLLEGCDQLLQEAESWKEQVSELTKQKLKVEVSVAHAEQLVNAKEDHISSLTERLLKMKVWAAVVEAHMTHDVHVELAMKSGSGSGALSDNHTKEALRKLMFAVKFNASFKSLEQERDQICMQLCEVERANEDLTEHIKQVHCEQEILQTETTELEVEKKKLCQDVKKLKELYEENGTKFYKKFMAEDHYQRDIQKKLSNMEEMIRQAAEDLETYKNAARELEEKLERTNHYYQRQIVFYEQKAHFNSLEVQAAEKQLKYFMKVNASTRQKLLKMELEFEHLERVPYASGISNAACGREHFPHDPSSLGQTSSEKNGFLSPPNFLEGPLRPPPLLPQGGGQGSRSRENPVDPYISNERRQPGNDRLTGLCRAPPESGSLSPPRKQDRIVMPPSDQPCTDPALPPQGRNSNVPVSSLRVQSQVVDPGFVPPNRGPFFPVHPSIQFNGRWPCFPQPAPQNVCGGSTEYFLPRGFPGPPYPPVPMRNVYLPRGFPNYLPPRAVYLPAVPTF